MEFYLNRKRYLQSALFGAVLASLVGILFSQTATPPKPATQATPAAPPKKAPPPKSTTPVTPVLTNQDIIKLVKAKIPDDLIIQKIGTSKTKFDTSVDGLVALREAGVSDRLLAVMMDPSTAKSAGGAAPATNPPPASAAPPGPVATRPLPPKPVYGSDQKGPLPMAATVTNVAKTPDTRPVEVASAPPNFGLYIADHGELKPLGRVQTKVQISKFRSLLHSIPFVRQKIDINIPGAHSTSRFETTRPTFFAYFPPSRDVSKFKLLQAKITGQNLDQRTVANASVMFSTEQNQDEVACDIGPTSVKDLYRIYPRENLSSGEFGFVEGNTGSKSTSNIEILDVYDFGVDRKEEKLPLKQYLDTLPAGRIADRGFLEMSREDCKKVVEDHEGIVGVTGSMLGWFKRQYASLDVYWADPQFVKAFARLEMLDRDLTADQAVKLASTLLSTDGSQYYVMVSVGGKVGSGKLIGANEGERLMRPFDASLTDEKGKGIVPAKKLEFIGGYAGLWKVTFDSKSLRGPVLNNESRFAVFEARLNQNLDFKAKFRSEMITDVQTPGND